jgi:pSer/pThr/pTyr-binding forkhead associated (FHA) protein
MHKLTLQVISGADRGRVFNELQTPMTIGREEGNTIRLNDERVSRFHVKIQDDGGRLVVTDLASTNGTRVNGHRCKLKILRFGDTIAIGRSVLLIGTREQIAGGWFNDSSAPGSRSDRYYGEQGELESLDNKQEFSTGIEMRSTDSSRNEVTLPRGLSRVQNAELTKLLSNICSEMKAVCHGSPAGEVDCKLVLERKSWHRLLELQSDLSDLIRNIEDPPDYFPTDLETGPA